LLDERYNGADDYAFLVNSLPKYGGSNLDSVSVQYRFFPQNTSNTERSRLSRDAKKIIQES
jgi:hypothetical protein